jgi:matrixin
VHGGPQDAQGTPVLPRRSWARAAAGVGVVLALSWSVPASGAGHPPGAGRYDFALPEGTVVAAPGERPTAGVGASPRPLDTPPSAPDGHGSWSFLDLQADGSTPVAYDPCRSVHWVLRPDDAPPQAEALVAGAVEEIAAATGLSFVYDGRTDERVTRDRAAYQPARYGDRWAPVLVSFEPPAGNPDVGGGIAGRGGSDAASAGGPWVYVTGTVLVDADWAARTVRSTWGRAAVRAVLVHELGHVVGLGHVEDDDELMYSDNDGQVDLGPGDLAGLARLGRGPCEPAL